MSNGTVRKRQVCTFGDELRAEALGEASRQVAEAQEGREAADPPAHHFPQVWGKVKQSGHPPKDCSQRQLVNLYFFWSP